MPRSKSSQKFQMQDIASASTSSKRKYASFEERKNAKNTRRREKRQSIALAKVKIIPDPLGCIVTTPDLLPDVPNCKFCGAKRFYLEPPTFCCSMGEIKLFLPEMPSELVELYLSTNEDATHFRNCIRSYNNMYAFTSMGVDSDPCLEKRNMGVYTFRVHGNIRHSIKQLRPLDGKKPKNVQLYFYDTEHELNNRMAINSKFNQNLLLKLIEILKVNPYAIFFRNISTFTAIDKYKIVLQADPSFDQRVFNKPTASQVAGIFLQSNVEDHNLSQHIQVYTKDNKTQVIKHYFSCYDPMQYPLIFPNGEPGWNRAVKRFSRKGKKIPCQIFEGSSGHDIRNYIDVDQFIQAEINDVTERNRERTTVSCCEYYGYKLQVRDDDRSFLLHTGRLLQQYVVDMYIKIETSRLDFFRHEDMQKRLRNDVYRGLLDGITQGCRIGADVGKRVILPTSFTGGPRDMRKRYLDALTLVQKYGKPDIFLTMTSNSNWPELKALCLPSDEPQNRPDLISRVFKSKLEILKNELLMKKIFGEVIAYTYVIEFQKRGLPHAHFLLILSPSSKIFTPEAYDRIVSAELPNPDTDPYLFKLVKKNMMHGPCGILDPTCACMKTGPTCKFHYPRNFSEVTECGANSYPIYRRRDNGRTVRKKGSQLDNRWVVPYNAYLLAKFDCHINVEICSTIQAVKYIYKGHDKIVYTLVANDENPVLDEIKNFQSARWISPPEATWRIFKFELSHTYPPIISLPIHLEDEQAVTFPADLPLENILSNPACKKTMLTQFFYMNKFNTDAKRMNCLYAEFPEYFTWHSNSKEWAMRERGRVLGRILNCHPSEGERFFLRLLLMHIRKPTSFTDLKTIHGHTYNTYREAAQSLGLMQEDNTSELCLREATAYLMPAALRQLFATVLVFCDPKNPKELFLHFEEFLSEDFRHQKNLSPQTVRLKVLDTITYYLYSMGKKLEDYFSISDYIETNQNNLSRELQIERDIIVSEEDYASIQNLNAEQKLAYDRILYHVNNNISKAFFLDGPGGTGKTYLYKAILAKIRSENNIALATATSGVAASLLPGGRTSHSRFKIPLDENDCKTCRVNKQSTLAYLLKTAKIIIWDEATMAKRSIIEKFDEMLRDIMNSNNIFGGKIVVFGGDFRQTLPIIPKGTRHDIVDASIVMSPLWNQLEKIKLTQNMRALLDPAFSSYLLKIGEGIEHTNDRDEIEIPSKTNIYFTDDVTSLNTLIDIVFPNISDPTFDSSLFVKRAILTTRNDFVHEINDILIDTFPGEENIYFSCDETTGGFAMQNQHELIHSLTPQGLPPHKLILKKNSPIILLRNINPTEGLCNGTRLICKGFNKNVIYATISIGAFVGKPVFIPRITLEASRDSFSAIPFKRKQFPVRLCFAMTINKAQGQTLDFVGIFLKEPVFSHGQLYVALSRAKTVDQLKILIRPPLPLIKNTHFTKNVVYHEVLSAAYSN